MQDAGIPLAPASKDRIPEGHCTVGITNGAEEIQAIFSPPPNPFEGSVDKRSGCRLALKQPMKDMFIWDDGRHQCRHEITVVMMTTILATVMMLMKGLMER
jgi:hypothetical protein